MPQEGGFHSASKRRRVGSKVSLNSGKHPTGVVVAHGGRDSLPPAEMLLDQAAFRFLDAKRKVVQALLALVDAGHHASEGAVLSGFGQDLLRHQQSVPNGTREALLQAVGLVFQLLKRADYELGGSGGRWGAKVGDKIDDREIRLGTDRGDDRYSRGDGGARQSFVVERGQVFGRTAATRDDDHVHISRTIEILQPGSDFGSGSLSLHLRGIDQHVRGVMAAPKNVKNVAQSSRLRRRYNPDAARELRNRLLASGFEQALSLKFCLELLECDLQRTRAFWFQIFSGKLQLAPAFVNSDAPAKDDLHPIVGAESQKPGL